jgi:hypothetical protein
MYFMHCLIDHLQFIIVEGIVALILDSNDKSRMQETFTFP